MRRGIALWLVLLAGLLQAATPVSAEVSAGRPRVVTTAPSLSEIMVELGAAAQVVGILDGGPRPAALEQVPSLGRQGQLNLEALLALQPDLILLWPDGLGSVLHARLRELGIPLIETQPHSLAELATQLAVIGRAVGRAEAGERLAGELRAGIAALQAQYGQRPVLEVFYQVWDRPLYTLGGRQIISDALRLCGARNVFDDLTLPAPQVSIEAVLARDPAVILVGDAHLAADWRRWSQLRAVRRQQVFVVPDSGLVRPSFQMLAATEKLCAHLDQAR